jgi:hypothetical protein
MERMNNREVVEEIHPNPPGHMSSVTEGVVRDLLSGKRYLVLLTGGTHKTVVPGEHYTINTVLRELLSAPEVEPAPSSEQAHVAEEMPI